MGWVTIWAIFSNTHPVALSTMLRAVSCAKAIASASISVKKFRLNI
jgi:hypothetical protein